MTDTPRPRKPWVLLRRDKPLLDFESVDQAKRFYDQLLQNGQRQPNAAIFGPGGVGWYRAASKTSYWVRDDDRRKREAVEVEPETAQ